MLSISLCTLEDARGNVEEDSADLDTIMRSLVRLVYHYADNAGRSVRFSSIQHPVLVEPMQFPRI
jgi:hypothetical protein